MQLVFEDSSTSPFFNSESEPHSPDSTRSIDHQCGSNNVIKTFYLDPLRQIAEVKVTVDRHVFITGLEMLYADGMTAFSHNFDQAGIVHSIKLESESKIVGLYGRQECLDITALGFIVLKK